MLHKPEECWKQEHKTDVSTKKSANGDKNEVTLKRQALQSIIEYTEEDEAES